jgi:FAD/FMN-containing dehydrogenase
MRGSATEQLGDVRGSVISPGDPEYDAARTVYNAMIDRHPRLIVRCFGADDVVAAVRYAAANDLPIAVRGGGHSVPGFGTADDALVIDLGAMTAIRVDPANQTATAEGGATWADFNAATHAYGLATTGGVVSTTGIGGLTLGGGIGYLARAHGLSCDNLIGADVVTADGTLVRASESQHPDLFWAIRGGGGNFGVVTSFAFRLHPVTDIYGGPMFYDPADAGDVLRLYRELIADAPEALGAFPGFHLAPPLPFIPEERHGRPVMVVVACWAGPADEGEAILRPFHEVAPVVAEHVGVMPYPALNSAFDALFPTGLQHYWKTAFAGTLTDDAIEAHVAWGPRVPAVSSVMHIYPINGACQRVDADATAFANRDASFATAIAGMWPDPADNEANIAWVRDYYSALGPNAETAGYVNFMSGDDQDQVRASYRDNYDRLVQVKRQYDARNAFRFNQNIRP